MVAKTKLSKPKKVSKVSKPNPKTKPAKLGKLFGKAATKKKPTKPKKKPVESFRENLGENEDLGEDMLEMMDEEDLTFLRSAINDSSYSILKKVHIPETTERIRKRKAREQLDTLEVDYEAENESKPPEVKMKNLLPIKTKSGIVKRTVKVDETTAEEQPEENKDADETEGYNDEGIASNSETEETEAANFEVFDESEPITPAQLLISRNKVLSQKKLHIGTLSSGILENPEEKIDNFQGLLKLLDEESCEIYISVRKLVIVALLEVFKDVLPSYQIKLQDISGVKVKKDTLKLHRFEEKLVSYYKKYLVKLEKFAGNLRSNRNGPKTKDEGEKSIGEVAVHAMCDLLVAHPYFNFSENLAQAIVPFLNNSNKNIRIIAAAALTTIFKEDKKEEITLKILRCINQFIKTRGHKVHTEMLEILLSLRIKEVNLDQEKETELKTKKLKSHKQNIISKLSKKERKRKKRLQELEKELMETKAEENKQTKMHNLTEITKILFNIYFRILKTSTNTKILSVCLEGLAKYAHCINLEYYVDIVNVLDKLLEEDWLGHKEKLHCIQTVFAILGGQGEALNLDPTRFYVKLYKDLLGVDAARSHINFSVLLHTVIIAIIHRRKRITNKRVIGFSKRLTTLSLQLLHGSSLACLAVVKTIMQLNKAADILLDVDNSIGDGKYDAELDDPEYCNASCTSLYELILLAKHYNPIVSKYAHHIAAGVPATGEGSLPPQYGKCSPEELYTNFDMSEMAFGPAVPVPKKVQPKLRSGFHLFADNDFRNECFAKSAMDKGNLKGNDLLFIAI